MAIIQGFPPSNTISPSVRITEKDLSFVPPEPSFHRAAIVGFASKGPINVPTVIRSTRELHTVFGYPHPDVGDPYLLYAGEIYLQVSNELFVLRVGDDDEVSDERAALAEVDIPSAGGQIIIQGSTAQSAAFVFANDTFFRWRLNGVLASKTLLVEAGSYSALQLVEDLNDQLSPGIDGIEFFVTGTGTASTVGVRTTFAYGPTSELELVSIIDAFYGPASIVGMGLAMTTATSTGSETCYPDTGSGCVAGSWDFTGLTDLEMKIVVDGTDNVLIDNVVQTVDLSALVGSVQTTTDIVDALNDAVTAGDVPGGWTASDVADTVRITTDHHGRDARLLIKTGSSGATILGFDGVTAVGVSLTRTTGAVDIDDAARVNGETALAGAVSFTVKADSPGIEGNETQITVVNDIRDNVFTVEVLNNGVQVEVWGNLTKDQTSRFYVETFLSLVSDFVRCTDNTVNPAPPADGTYSLAGGSDGIPSDPDKQDELIIGSDIAFTGMYAFSEPEQIDIDLIAVPGHSSTSIVIELLRLCQYYRQDAMAIIDPPFGLTVKEIVHWQNGSHPLNTTRFDSDFGALYWPWVKYRDNHNRVDVWIPPSGAVMAVYARSDSFAAPWFAPAGVSRGLVPAISDVFSRPTLAERDLMYGNRNAINPIVQFADFEGFVVWGQKTLQRRPTALDRVNVRRLMFVIEKRIRQASRQLLFDPHDEQFRQQFISIADTILREIAVGRGIHDYIIQADEELNTPDVIDRNEFRARIGIQPIRAVEFIFIEFSVHRTGSFTQTTDAF